MERNETISVITNKSIVRDIIVVGNWVTGLNTALHTIENYFQTTRNLIKQYNTYFSNKVNDVMKVLTILASIFIPLTFIAGIYRTNFEYVLELQLKNFNLFMWGAILIVAITMLNNFNKHKWF